MESAAAAAMPLAQVCQLAATASNNFNNFGDDNDVELSIDLETSIHLEMMES